MVQLLTRNGEVTYTLYIQFNDYWVLYVWGKQTKYNLISIHSKFIQINLVPFIKGKSTWPHWTCPSCVVNLHADLKIRCNEKRFWIILFSKHDFYWFVWRWLEIGFQIIHDKMIDPLKGSIQAVNFIPDKAVSEVLTLQKRSTLLSFNPGNKPLCRSHDHTRKKRRFRRILRNKFEVFIMQVPSHWRPLKVCSASSVANG